MQASLPHCLLRDNNALLLHPISHDTRDGAGYFSLGIAGLKYPNEVKKGSVSYARR